MPGFSLCGLQAQGGQGQHSRDLLKCSCFFMRPHRGAQGWTGVCGARTTVKWGPEGLQTASHCQRLAVESSLAAVAVEVDLVKNATVPT